MPTIKLCRLERYIIHKHLGVPPDAIDGATPRALLIGEAPGPNTRSDCPMLPYPPGSAGGRLLEMSGMTAEAYLRAFARADLLDQASPGGWTVDERERAFARARTLFLDYRGGSIVLLGAQVARCVAPLLAHARCTEQACIGVDRVVLDDFEVVTIGCGASVGTRVVRLPHPSGRNRLMRAPSIRVAVARALEAAIAPRAEAA